VPDGPAEGNDLTPLRSKGSAAMSDITTAPVFSQNGRKGISYDWQSLYAEAQAESIDRELAQFAPALAE
jgi:hypothetical protein